MRGKDWLLYDVLFLHPATSSLVMAERQCRLRPLPLCQLLTTDRSQETIGLTFRHLMYELAKVTPAAGLKWAAPNAGTPLCVMFDGDRAINTAASRALVGPDCAFADYLEAGHQHRACVNAVSCMSPSRSLLMPGPHDTRCCPADHRRHTRSLTSSLIS